MPLVTADESVYGPWPGRADLAAAAASLATRLPAPLAPLATIAYTYRWCWLAGGEELFAGLEPHRWALVGGNPVRMLQETRVQTLERAADDDAYLAEVARVETRLRAEAGRQPVAGRLHRDRPVAFFCTEFAVHRSLPVYAGGLGVLAGDLLKQGSDKAVPMVGVGLMYRQGYFRQRIDLSGWQHEYWVDTDPERLPAALVTGDDGAPLTITAPVRGREVVAQIWRVDVGSVPLYLLDAERPENHPVDRWTTGRLYSGDASTRLAQYVLLGVGGVRALRALGIDPGVVHLNEGHAALAPLELARGAAAAGRSPGAALEEAASRTVFTTHTPVAAGNDVYDGAELLAAVGDLPAALGLAPDELLALGRAAPGDTHVGITPLGLRVSRSANGVSRRHGEVARDMWKGLYDGRSVDEVPITSVTNGVHLPTWVAPPMRDLLDRYLAPGWEGSSDPGVWAAVGSIPDEELWATRRALRGRLADYVRARGVDDRLSRGEALDYVEAVEGFDPDLLTIGFARRLATYKRLHLLVHDIDRALRLLDGDRPVQLVVAGKAHPRDEEAKRLVQALFAAKGAPQVGPRVAFIHDYDVGVASWLVAGCDVWVNLPRPPLEASGTSGMKSAVNGGLQLSVLDGWWAEAYDGTNGWAISGEVDPDTWGQDARHAAAQYELIEREVVPAFYDRDERGIPVAWLARVRRSLATIGPAFGAARMLEDYLAGPYAATEGPPAP